MKFDPILKLVDIVREMRRDFRLSFEAEFSINQSVESERPCSIRTLKLILDGIYQEWKRIVGLLVSQLCKLTTSFGGFRLFAERKGLSTRPFIRRVGFSDVNSQEDGFVVVFFAHLFKK